MDDKELQDKIAEAKAAGYTDEEIRAYLNPEAPVQQPKDRSQEYTAMGQFGVLGAGEKLGELAVDAAKYALPAYGAYKGGQAIANRLPTPVAPPTPPSSNLIVPQNVGAGPRPTVVPNVTPGTPAQTFEALGDRYSPRVTAPTTVPATNVPQAQMQAGSFLDNIAQKYGTMSQKVAPVLQKAAPMLEGAGRLLAPAMIAKELFYTSPEERAILQRAENEKRAKGWRPINER